MLRSKEALAARTTTVLGSESESFRKMMGAS